MIDVFHIEKYNIPIFDFKYNMLNMAKEKYGLLGIIKKIQNKGGSSDLSVCLTLTFCLV